MSAARATAVVLAGLRRDALEARADRTGLAARALSQLGLLFSAYFVARTFAGHEPPAIAGAGGYLLFLLVGLGMGDLSYACLCGAAQRVREGQLAGTLLAERAAGPPLLPYLLAQGLFGQLGALLRLGLALGLGFALADAPPPLERLPAALLAAALAIAAHLPVGLLGAAVTLWLRRTDPLGRGLHAVSMLLSGVAYPVEILPSWLAAAAELSPTTHALRALRAALAGPPGHELAQACAALAAFAGLGLVVAAPLARHLDRRARRAGSLAQY